VAEIGSVLTVLRGTTYLGTHPRALRRVEDVDILFTDRGLHIRLGRHDVGEISWETITELSAATFDSEERRISWWWVLVLGFWALLMVNKTTYAYLTVSDSGGEWAFAVPDITAGELRAGLEPLRARVQTRLLAT
jgi:hypothetical protein